jgi:hypothetical protein
MNTTTVSCDNGYTGRGEFIDLTDRLCNVNDTAVLALHIFGIIWAVTSQCLSYHAIYDVIMKAARRHHTPGVPINNNNTTGSSHGGNHGHNHPSGNNGVATSFQHRYGWIWHAIIGQPASLIGCYCIGFAVFSLIYHLLRVAGGHGSEIYASWPTTIITMFAFTVYWIGASHFAWVIIKHTTASMKLERGSVATQASLDRFRFFCHVFAVAGICGDWTALLLSRLATNVDQQTASMTLFFFTITICGMVLAPP